MRNRFRSSGIRNGSSPGRGTTSATRRPSWQDHPLAVAAIAVCATITVGGMVVKDLIIPAHVASLTNELTQQPKLIKANKDLTEKVSQLTVEIKDLRTQLGIAQLKNPFTDGVPYPQGVDRVRIGDPMTKVKLLYGEQPLRERKLGYWTVQTKNAVFPEAVYYFDKSAAQQKVTGILFIGSGNITDGILEPKLRSLLGEPRTLPDDDGLSWKVNGYELRLRSRYVHLGIARP